MSSGVLPTDHASDPDVIHLINPATSGVFYSLTAPVRNITALLDAHHYLSH